MDDDSDSRCERVVLNVGGRTFETSISTLANSSSYFASQFSDKWSRHGNNEHRFIDQDPNAFAVLLSFMRLGFVKEEQLTDDVLFQAEFFGIDILVNEVKSIAYRAHDPGFTGTDDEAMESFHEEFGCIADAVANGYLPALLLGAKHPAGASEYASLYFHFNDQRCDGSVIPYHAGLCTKMLNSTQQTESLEPAPDAGGFMNPIFALNFLGKFGFRLAHPQLQNYACPIKGSNSRLKPMPPFNFPTRPSLETRGYHLGEWVFCRESQPRKEGERAIISPSTIQDGNRPVEYASVLWTRGRESFITAAGGEPVSFQRLGGAAVRNVGIMRLRNITAALQWLERKGFTKREEEIEGIFESACTVKLEQQNRNVNQSFPEYEGGRIMIYSRPLREHDPLLNNVIPLAFGSERDDRPHNIVFPSLNLLSRLPFA